MSFKYLPDLKMQSIGGLLGTAGGIQGTGVQGPQQASIQQGTSAADVQGGQAGVNNSLASQNALLQALQSQNGFGQQNAVAQQQNNLNGQLNAADGIGTQNSAIQGLQGVAGQYQNIANGTGPNPAQAMLNQSTGQNVANQAALMAGQRGAGSNVGLLARQAGQQGAATQQQAVGQGATMQANQQIAGLQGLANTQQAIGGLGSTQLGAQQAQQAALANQANAVAGQQIGGTSAATQAQLANQGQLQGALGNLNSANVSNQGNINAANAGIANTTLQGQQKFVGGVLNKLGAGAVSLAGGGEVRMAAGGYTPPPAIAVHGPSSSFGQFMMSGPAVAGPQSTDSSLMQGKSALDYDPINKKKKDAQPAVTNSGVGDLGSTGDAGMMAGPDAADASMMAPAAVDAGTAGGLADLAPLALMGAEGGKVSAMLSEKEVIVPPKDAGSPKKAASYVKKEMAEGGGVKAKTPEQKAVKGGNSYDNDKIPAKLPVGAIVIPRSVTTSKDPVRSSADFVAKVLAKRKAKAS